MKKKYPHDQMTETGTRKSFNKAKQYYKLRDLAYDKSLNSNDFKHHLKQMTKVKVNRQNEHSRLAQELVA